MSTVVALNSHFRGTDSCSTCVSNDTWNQNKLPNKVALKFSQHLRVFICVNLYLEKGNTITFLEVQVEIVSLINLLNGFLKL
jgi:hypothetical protein